MTRMISSNALAISVLHFDKRPRFQELSKQMTSQNRLKTYDNASKAESTEV